MTREQLESTRQPEQLAPKEINFNRSKFSLLLKVEVDQLDLETVQDFASKNYFQEKSEFHITVIGFRTGNEIKKLLKDLPDEEKQEKVAQIEKLAQSIDWSFTIDPAVWRVEKEYPQQKNGQEDRRESLVKIVDLPGMAEFFASLNELLATDFEPRPAHITLYTKGTDPKNSRIGIGINSQAELESLQPKKVA